MHLHLRLDFDGLRLGPGKARLLELIRDEGSISAAGRAMGMSYRRAWSLVEEMNAAFAEPLVASARGGAKGGGAGVTEAGLAVLAAYRRLERVVLEQGAAEVGQICDMLRQSSPTRVTSGVGG